MILGTGKPGFCLDNNSAGNLPPAPDAAGPGTSPAGMTSSMIPGVWVIPSPSREACAPPLGAGGTRGASSQQDPAPLGSYTLTDTISALQKTLSDVRNNPELRKFQPLCRKFVDYLRWMDSAGLQICGFNTRTNTGRTISMGMSHRWTRAYKNKLLAKLYLLDEYIKENPSAITLMTLTTYHDLKYREGDDSPRLSIPEAFAVLKTSWKKLSMIIRKKMPGTEYIWIVEPQKSGYPHLHVVLFADVSIGMQDGIKAQWAKYQAGDYEHGAQFEIRQPEDSIESLRNYLMKYIAKGFVSTESRFGDHRWTSAELVFNALVWDGNYRTFQPSRGLQQYMGWTPGRDDAIYWHTNTMEYESQGDTGTKVVWEKSILGWIPGRALAGPDPDPEDLCPEDEIVRQLWKNQYEARNRRGGTTSIKKARERLRAGCVT